MSDIHPTVCAMLLTYADRAPLCRQVIERLVNMGVRRIIIIDNASQESSRLVLEKIATQTPQINLLRQTENLGSAKGFRVALEEAFRHNEEFFLLLDDDNLPAEDCLQKLFTAHSLFEADQTSILLHANRSLTRPADSASFENGFTRTFPENGFCGQTAEVIFTAWKKKLHRRQAGAAGQTNYPVVRVHCGPYGGMFARRSVFEQVGPPRDDYYLYADDHEYTIRMDRNGISQFLIEPAVIVDLDISFAPDTGFLSEKTSPMKIYYMVRNNVHLGLPLIKSRWRYGANKAAFFARLILKGRRDIMKNPYLSLSRWRLIRRAISDGEAGRLGKTFQQETRS